MTKVFSTKMKSSSKVGLFVFIFFAFCLFHVTTSWAAWEITTVDSANGGVSSSLALDSSNKSHISYDAYKPNQNIKYAIELLSVASTSHPQQAVWYTAPDFPGKILFSQFLKEAGHLTPAVCNR